MNGLRIETLTFRESERQQWCGGNHDMLEKSAASAFLRRVLTTKAIERQNGSSAKRSLRAI